MEEITVDREEGIETVCAVFTPRVLDNKLQKVKQICVCSVYIAPRSQKKTETMDHITQTIHFVRSILLKLLL